MSQANRQFDSGTVLVKDKRIELTKFNGSEPKNIYLQVSGFDIYEDLENYTVTAEFYISDGIELINEYPLGGEERISLTLQTPERKEIEYKFIIESIAGLKVNDMANMKSYVLRCVTEDYLKNCCTVYTKRYKDMGYDVAAATVILNDLQVGRSSNDKKDIVTIHTIENTKGTFDYVVNNKRPFQVMDVIKERAVSKENASSLFVFYQDNVGYHFQTVEKLIKDRKPYANAKTFSYDTSLRSEDLEKVVNQRTILSYETLTQGNQAAKVVSGAMRSVYREFDISRGTYFTKNEYRNSKDHKEYVSTDESKNDFNSAVFRQFVEKMPAVTRMTVKDGLRPEMFHNLNLHYQRPFIERLNQYIVRIRVYGDTDMRVGDVINLQFPEISGITVEPKQAKIYSGNYLVTRLKHRCDMTKKNDFLHFMVMECCKTSQFGRELG